jgi:hypothetical protein
MATVKISLHPRAAIPASSNGAQHKVVDGTNFPVPSLAFDASTEESVFFTFRAASYGSGNLTLTLNWYADTASSGDVVFGAAIAAITPNTDSQDIETKAFATAQTVTDSHIGTTGQRLHECAITISNLDSIAANDWVVLKLYRVAADAGDTMTGDALVTMAELSYSDT